MRIWSLHPKYLDAKGLVALWREALLAKHVLQERTKGYKNHPQLLRFKNCKRPVDAINQYLADVYKEATARGYHFDRQKIDFDFKRTKLKVSSGQLQYEWQHLMQKLKQRDINKYNETKNEVCTHHPLFTVFEGAIEEWEVL